MNVNPLISTTVQKPQEERIPLAQQITLEVALANIKRIGEFKPTEWPYTMNESMSEEEFQGFMQRLYNTANSIETSVEQPKEKIALKDTILTELKKVGTSKLKQTKVEKNEFEESDLEKALMQNSYYRRASMSLSAAKLDESVAETNWPRLQSAYPASRAPMQKVSSAWANPVDLATKLKARRAFIQPSVAKVKLD